ncbi:VanZ family protein [Algoriphagus sp. CAU 1675]|uniref:VanZ family protein n=1 Tax=Algoriphagus sp. CAU 1675 TaxID=3032597 RepID=UPI0023DB59A1|nr:VanZ family protein [Algoriphagus sp. CAU 1675]MDF2158332.1 VanZ family protein [Algoriphagus sp. CAU 1675]
MKNLLKSTRLTRSLFLIYWVALVWIIVFKLNIQFTYMEQGRKINLIPYSQPLMLNGEVDFGEIILNCLIFIPFGLYAGVLFEKWKLGKTIGLFFFSSLALELSQYGLGIGTFDTTDIINNTLGGILGLMGYMGIELASKNRQKTHQIINLLTLIGTLSFVLILLFLKINCLWFFRM